MQLTQDGRVSLGALDRMRGGPERAGRFAIPAIELEIEDGQALIDAPFGDLNAAFSGDGTLGTDFSGIGAHRRNFASGRRTTRWIAARRAHHRVARR